jgi:hypothetical protein
MQKLREIHADGRGNDLPFCNECTMPQVSLPMLLGTLFLHDLSIKKLLPRIEQLSILKNIKRVSYFE